MTGTKKKKNREKWHNDVRSPSLVQARLGRCPLLPPESVAVVSSAPPSADYRQERDSEATRPCLLPSP